MKNLFIVLLLIATGIGGWRYWIYRKTGGTPLNVRIQHAGLPYDRQSYWLWYLRGNRISEEQLQDFLTSLYAIPDPDGGNVFGVTDCSTEIFNVLTTLAGQDKICLVRQHDGPLVASKLGHLKCFQNLAKQCVSQMKIFVEHGQLDQAIDVFRQSGAITVACQDGRQSWLTAAECEELRLQALDCILAKPLSGEQRARLLQGIDSDRERHQECFFNAMACEIALVSDLLTPDSLEITVQKTGKDVIAEGDIRLYGAGVKELLFDYVSDAQGKPERLIKRRIRLNSGAESVFAYNKTIGRYKDILSKLDAVKTKLNTANTDEASM